MEMNNYIELLPYNGTIPTGGDSIHQNLNVYYESGNIAWMIMGTGQSSTLDPTWKMGTDVNQPLCCL